MKKVLFTLTALMLSIAVYAQEDKAVRVPEGYSGFLEHSLIYRLADHGYTTTGLSTTHGLYFNGNTFVGIGCGLEGGDDFFAMPIFTAVKYNFGYSGPATATIQLRLGSCVSEKTGPYADIAAGVRFGSKQKKFAVNVMLTGTYYTPYKYYGYVYDDFTGTSQRMNVTKNRSGVGLRVGIEW